MNTEAEIEFLKASLKEALERIERLELAPYARPMVTVGTTEVAPVRAQVMWASPETMWQASAGETIAHSHSVNDPGFQHGELPISLPTAAVDGNAAFQQAMQSNYVQGSLSPPLRAYNLSEDDARRLGLPASDTFHSALGGPIDWCSLKTQK